MGTKKVVKNQKNVIKRVLPFDKRIEALFEEYNKKMSNLSVTYYTQQRRKAEQTLEKMLRESLASMENSLEIEEDLSDVEVNVRGDDFQMMVKSMNALVKSLNKLEGMLK